MGDSDLRVLCLEARCRDIHSVRADVELLSERFSTGETSISFQERCASQLEQAQSTQAAQVTSLQLHMEELEDRSRHNNLRLRGIPEATVLEICRQTSTSIAPQDLEFDRALATQIQNRPRDIICPLHRYSQKYLILCKAWEVGEID